MVFGYSQSRLSKISLSKTKSVSTKCSWQSQEFHIQNSKSLKLLDYIGYYPKSNIHQANPRYGNKQTFVLISAGANYYYIKNVNSGLYIEVKDKTPREGTNIYQNKFSGKDAQKFKFIPARNNGPTVSTITSKSINEFYIEPKLNKDLCVEAQSETTKHLGNIQLWRKKKKQHQRFKLIPVRPNYGELTINWAGVLDNGEGSDKPIGKRGIIHHGPFGSLHILIYEPGTYFKTSATKYPKPLRHIKFSGPHKIETHTYKPDKYEWDDGDEKYFNGSLSLFKWRHPNDAVLVFVYESDPDRKITKREHDPIFYKVIHRNNVNKPSLIGGGFTAHSKAIGRAMKRGAEKWIISRELKRIYGKSLPKMVAEFETRSYGRIHEDRPID